MSQEQFLGLWGKTGNNMSPLILCKGSHAWSSACEAHPAHLAPRDVLAPTVQMQSELPSDRGHHSHVGFAVRHRDSQLSFFKLVPTLLIITVLIMELFQPCMIDSVSLGEYCQGNVNEGWQSPLQQPSGVQEPCLRPEALTAH